MTKWEYELVSGLESASPALEFGEDHDGAERLLDSDVHVVLDISEHRGLEEKTWKQDRTDMRKGLWNRLICIVGVASEVDHMDRLISETRYVIAQSCLTWPLHLFAATHQSGPILDAGLTVLHQFVQVSFVVLRAVVSGAVQRITDLHLLDLINLREMKPTKREICTVTLSFLY